MNAQELAMIKQVNEILVQIGELRGKLEAVEKENEFLRGLLKDKLENKD